MNKPTILSLAAILCVATASYSQSTTGSSGQAANQQSQSAQSGNKNNGNQSTDQSRQNSSTQSANQNQSQSNAKPGGQSNQNTSGQKGLKDDDVKSSTRPGGETHENANYVGRDSEKEDSKSMLNSKKAIAERKKNLTEPDTTLKKGSGSARKNMKNHTGKTGNYRNEGSKNNQGNP